MFKVTNHQGVQADCSYLVCDNNQVYAFDALGAEVAVKAIFASAFGQSKRFTFTGNYRDTALRYCHRELDRSLGYEVEKQALLTNPNLYRYCFKAPPRPGDPYLIVYGLEDWRAATPLHALYWALQQRPWPIDARWTAHLFECGTKSGLVEKLQIAGRAKFAFKVQVQGWDALLDQAARSGDLYIPPADADLDTLLAGYSDAELATLLQTLATAPIATAA